MKPFVPEILKSKVAVFVELFNKKAQIAHQGKLLQKSNLELRQEIAERKRVESDLRRLNDTLEERVAERTATAEQRSRELAAANAELSQFAYVVSHDLKEPLRMIASYCQLLQHRNQGIDAKSNEYIGIIVDGAARMHNLINDLLAIAQVELKEKPLQPTRCEAVLREVLNNLKMTIEERSAKITHDPLPQVMSHHTRMMELLQNLISNGIKFNKNPMPAVHVSAKKQGKEWVFSVRDNGIGIDPQYRDRVFVMFQRLHPRSEYAGSGIGLGICKKIVEQHGGRIWIESEPEKGTTFYFTIPQAAQPETVSAT